MKHLSVLPSPTSFAEPLPPMSGQLSQLPSTLSGELTPRESTTQPPAPEPIAAQPSVAQRHVTLQVFISTFFTIFLAELGDKTQVTTLLMSAESHAPWIVFAGASAALIATSLIGVWLGCWLAKRVAPKTLETAAGCLLLLVAAQLIWDVIHL